MADDSPPLLFKRVLGSLRPANKAADDALAIVGDSAVRVRITSVRGNTKRNGLYWAIVGICAPILTEICEGDALTQKMLHRVLKKRYGLAPKVTLPSGEVEYDYDAGSTAFHRMNEMDRAIYVDWALATLSKWTGIAIDDLRREGMAQSSF